jgi:hypothetical protein
MSTEQADSLFSMSYEEFAKRYVSPEVTVFPVNRVTNVL